MSDCSNYIAQIAQLQQELNHLRRELDGIRAITQSIKDKGLPENVGKGNWAYVKGQIDLAESINPTKQGDWLRNLYRR